MLQAGRYSIAICVSLATTALIPRHARADLLGVRSCQANFESCRGNPLINSVKQCQILLDFAIKDGGVWGSAEARIASNTVGPHPAPPRACLL
jgi:hypothetical protein